MTRPTNDMKVMASDAMSLPEEHRPSIFIEENALKHQRLIE
jgi:hypothetical protein